MSELSKSDEWEIPTPDYEDLTKKYDFIPTLDVSATLENTKCQQFLTISQNALDHTWNKKNWSNPPAHFYLEFVAKAHQEFTELGNETMMILPANSLCTTYAKQHIIEHAEFYPIIGRFNFLHFGEDKGRARNAYFVIIWRKI